MNKTRIYKYIGIAALLVSVASCKIPEIAQPSEDLNLPQSYNGTTDTLNIASMEWKDYFDDPYLDSLIATGLQNNQELKITLREIEIANNEIRAKKGEYLPFVGLRAGADVDKKARYTSLGASEATTDIRPGKEMPEPLQNYTIGAYATWEIDIWGKLHNAKKAAVTRYLATMEGKNFLVTNLVAEIASSYYELLALDNELEIVKQNIELQTNALKIVKVQKEAARTTELAVKKFEAELLNSQSLQYDIQQNIIETENRINFLVGRYPQHVARNTDSFHVSVADSYDTGLPAQLLQNRPDIKQAELELVAAKLDVKVAKARFYPSLGISAGIGYSAFNTKYLLDTPESLLYNIAGDLVAPLINRNEIKASYSNASNKQIQVLIEYQKTVLNAYIEVANGMANLDNLKHNYELKEKQVDALTKSIQISNDLFKSARADYMEVLLTQRDALESKFQLIETKVRQLRAKVEIYRALGGGWN